MARGPHMGEQSGLANPNRKKIGCDTHSGQSRFIFRGTSGCETHPTSPRLSATAARGIARLEAAYSTRRHFSYWRASTVSVTPCPVTLVLPE